MYYVLLASRPYHISHKLITCLNSFQCSNLLSKYVGETEKLLSQVFIRAQQAAPSVVFMDEVDSLCGERGGGGSLVSELLSLMSQTAVQRNIMVIGATNRPHAVDEVRFTVIS